jgi:hypothetical protein
VSAASRLRYLYLAFLSKPPAYRALYRLIRRHRPQNLVEIGIGDARRSARMIAVARRYARGQCVRYTGIDLFEDAPSDHASLPLKTAYRLLRTTGAQIRLEPGDPHWALARAANSLSDTDLLFISADTYRESMTSAWFYVPRMLHPCSLVLVEEVAADQKATIRTLSKVEIAALAPSPNRRMAA